MGSCVTDELEVLKEPHVADGTATGLRAHGKLLGESKDVVHVLTVKLWLFWLWLWWLWWWWCGRDALRVCLSIRASCVQLIKMDQCQRTGPFGWTDQPENPKPVPSEGRFQASPVKKFTQPQGEEKDCEARPPRLPLLRRKGSAIFSISSALGAQDLGPE